MYGFSRTSIAPYAVRSNCHSIPALPRRRPPFIVVDVKSLYNVMLGRPALYNLRPILSVYHLSVKFPMTSGIYYLLKNQGTAHKCYNALFSLAKKTSSVAITSKGTNKTSSSAMALGGRARPLPRKLEKRQRPLESKLQKDRGGNGGDEDGLCTGDGGGDGDSDGLIVGGGVGDGDGLSAVRVGSDESSPATKSMDFNGSS
uniref:Uncharacterized protein n=1 Tax=Cannabis sativa TaxID=3483 RepID=A0A803NJA1_CANSA